MSHIRINNSEPVQENFQGHGGIYHCYAEMPDDWNRTYPQELCDLEALRAGNMKLKLARTFFLWYAWDNDKKKWDWNNEKMQAVYNWLERLKKQNIDVAINTGWCSPGDVNDSSWNRNSPFNVEGDWKKSCENFGNWVSEVYHQIIELRGFTNVKVFVMFTEPQNPDGTIPDGKGAYEVWLDAVKAAHNAMVRDGRRNGIKFMGPNEDGSPKMLEWVAKNASEYIDIYSNHCYLRSANVYSGKILTGKRVAGACIAGARIFRDIKLKPHTEYEVKAVISEMNYQELSMGTYVFGIFDSGDVNDIYNDEKTFPFPPLCQNSIMARNPHKGNEYREISFKFTSDKKTKGKFGLFYDVKMSTGFLLIDRFEVIETETGKNILKNNNFRNEYDGWTTILSEATDSYKLVYEYAKKSLSVIPKGAEFCFDEYNTMTCRDYKKIDHGSQVVNFAMALMNAGVTYTLMWTIFDQIWPYNHGSNNDSFYEGDHRCGLMPALTRSLTPYHSYYAFTLLCRYATGDGSKVYEGFGEECLQGTMTVSKKGEVSIIIVNDKEIEDDFEIKLDKPLNMDLNRHYYNSTKCVPDDTAQIIGIDRIEKNVGDTIKGKIAPYSVMVFTNIED